MPAPHHSNLNPAGPTAGAPEPEHRSRLGSALNIETSRLPSSRLTRFLRWWLPTIVCLVGVAIAIIDNFDDTGLEALAALLGAGSSIWLMNFLWRLGVSGDEDRVKEEEARVFLEVHGHWPDEPGPDR